MLVLVAAGTAQTRPAATPAWRTEVDALKAKGLATRKAVPVKVLGQGELTKALTVHAHGFSKSAREKIEAAGGTCQVAQGAARAK